MSRPQGTIRSILAASDLGPASDRVVQSAAAPPGQAPCPVLLVPPPGVSALTEPGSPAERKGP